VNTRFVVLGAIVRSKTGCRSIHATFDRLVWNIGDFEGLVIAAVVEAAAVRGSRLGGGPLIPLLNEHMAHVAASRSADFQRSSSLLGAASL